MKMFNRSKLYVMGVGTLTFMRVDGCEIIDNSVHQFINFVMDHTLNFLVCLSVHISVSDALLYVIPTS